ncbi:MAG: hypothetical protein AAGB51_14690 [Planctomycetota bacterium]
MNWPLFALCLWILLGFELSAKAIIALGPTGIAPSFVIPLAVFVALGAPPVHALWACLIAGLCLDLTGRAGGSDAVVPGPHALGMLLAGQLVLATRSIVIRRNPLTLAALSAAAALLTGLVVVFLYGIRSLLFGSVDASGWDQLVARSGAALYTGVTGLLLALVLVPSVGLFGFQTDHLGRGGSRRF